MRERTIAPCGRIVPARVLSCARTSHGAGHGGGPVGVGGPHRATQAEVAVVGDEQRISCHRNAFDLVVREKLAGGIEREQQRAKVKLDSATVVLDPPRAGAGAKVIDLLTKLAPKHIVYVACDPVALARDLKGLLAGGYELKELRAFDLFPHTHHVEAIASLVRK